LVFDNASFLPHEEWFFTKIFKYLNLKKKVMTDIKKGTVVRGLKNANLRPFDTEVLDEHGRLMEASVNCKEGVNNVAQIMLGMEPAMHQFGIRIAKVEKIIQKGGRVMIAPVPGNPNHCQIFGLSLKDANDLFS
jgi:hypothetical protein